MKGQLENVEGTIDQIKMKIGQLTNAETTRAQTVATATQVLIEKERELQELRERGAKKSEIAKAKGAVGAKTSRFRCRKVRNVIYWSRRNGGTRVRDEMTTQAQNALNAEIGTLRDALRNFEVTGKFDDADVFTKINDSFQRLKDAGIKGIEVDINASDEAIAKQIQTIEELITLTNQLNNQKKLRNAMEKQITAEIEY